MTRSPREKRFLSCKYPSGVGPLINHFECKKLDNLNKLLWVCFVFTWFTDYSVLPRKKEREREGEREKEPSLFERRFRLRPNHTEILKNAIFLMGTQQTKTINFQPEACPFAGIQPQATAANHFGDHSGDHSGEPGAPLEPRPRSAAFRSENHYN